MQGMQQQYSPNSNINSIFKEIRIFSLRIKVKSELANEFFIFPSMAFFIVAVRYNRVYCTLQEEHLLLTRPQIVL